MAIALDATSQGNAVGNLTVAHTIGNGLNRYLLVFIYSDGSTVPNSFPTGIKYNGTSLTQFTTAAESDFSNTITVWYLADPSLPVGGTYNIVVTANPANNRVKMHAATFSGVAATAPEALNNTTSTSGVNSVSTNITTVSVNDWLVDYVAAGGTGTFTQNAAQTLLGTSDATQFRQTAASYKPVTTATLYSMSWSLSTTIDINQVVVALAPAFSAPGTYTYTFSQTANNSCDAGVLLSASTAANLASSQATRIDTANSIITFYFNGTLSGGDKALLDAIVAAHNGLILTTTPSPVPINGSWTTIPTNMTASVDVSQNLFVINHMAIDGRLQLDGRLVETL